MHELLWGYDYRLGNKLTAEVSKAPDGWRMLRKKVNILTNDLAIDNLTFIV